MLLISVRSNLFRKCKKLITFIEIFSKQLKFPKKECVQFFLVIWIGMAKNCYMTII